MLSLKKRDLVTKWGNDDRKGTNVKLHFYIQHGTAVQPELEALIVARYNNLLCIYEMSSLSTTLHPRHCQLFH